MRKLLIIGAAFAALSVAACGKPAETRTETAVTEATPAPEATLATAATPAPVEGAAAASTDAAAPAATTATTVTEEKKADH